MGVRGEGGKKMLVSSYVECVFMYMGVPADFMCLPVYECVLCVCMYVKRA